MRSYIELVVELADVRAQRDMLLAAANDLSQAYGPDADYDDDIGGQRTRAWNAIHRAIDECEDQS